MENPFQAKINQTTQRLYGIGKTNIKQRKNQQLKRHKTFKKINLLQR